MKKNQTKKRGRPVGTKSENPATKSLAGVRITQDQLTTYKAAAEKSGKTFSAWVRSVLDKASK